MKKSNVVSKLLLGLVLVSMNGMVLAADSKTSDKAANYEETVAPLLKDIGRKNAVLQVKTIELELKKINKEMEKLDDPSSFSGSGGQGSNSSEMEELRQKVRALEVSAAKEKANEASAIKVLSVSGFKDDLRAKVAIGKRSGYYVRASDVLPDGSVVLSVESNYMIISQMGKRVIVPISPPESENKSNSFDINAMMQGADSSITATPTSILQRAAQPIPASVPMMTNSR